jgi:DNA-binding response OmpR family regulator
MQATLSLGRRGSRADARDDIETRHPRNTTDRETPQTVDVHIAWLRQKLEEVPAAPRHLLTIHGVGYKFVA